MQASRPTQTLYRVFQRLCQPGLCCAMREAVLVPRFLRPGTWDFGANVREGENLPFGFQPAPAREPTRRSATTSSTIPARPWCQDTAAAGREGTSPGLRQIKGVYRPV